MQIAFIPTGNAGVSFYRVWQPAEALRARGHKVAVMWYKHDMIDAHPWEFELGNFNSIYSDLKQAFKWAQVVVCQKLHTEESLRAILSLKTQYKKPVLMELDDNIFSIPEANAAVGYYDPGAFHMKLSHQQMKQSDGMVVSTPDLAEVCGTINKHVYISQNVIDLKLWRGNSSHPRRSKNITIGWFGGGNHNADLEIAYRALCSVAAARPKVQVKVMCGAPKPDWFQQKPNMRWLHDYTTIDKYPKLVRKLKLDIGLAPLVDNAFNRSKSNLRWLEYSALGIPCVASNVGHFTQTITPGSTGILVENDGWKTAIETLIESTEYRLELGMAAQQIIEHHWNPQTSAKQYEQIFKEVRRKCQA